MSRVKVNGVGQGEGVRRRFETHIEGELCKDVRYNEPCNSFLSVFIVGCIYGQR